MERTGFGFSIPETVRVGTGTYYPPKNPEKVRSGNPPEKPLKI